MKVAAVTANRLRRQCPACGERLIRVSLSLSRSAGALHLLYPRQVAARRSVLTKPERVIGLHQFVNFARALVDHRAFAISIETPDRVFVGIAIRAVDLDGVPGRTLGRDRREPLRQAG